MPQLSPLMWNFSQLMLIICVCMLGVLFYLVNVKLIYNKKVDKFFYVVWCW